MMRTGDLFSTNQNKLSSLNCDNVKETLCCLLHEQEEVAMLIFSGQLAVSQTLLSADRKNIKAHIIKVNTFRDNFQKVLSPKDVETLKNIISFAKENFSYCLGVRKQEAMYGLLAEIAKISKVTDKLLSAVQNSLLTLNKEKLATRLKYRGYHYIIAREPSSRNILLFQTAQTAFAKGQFGVVYDVECFSHPFLKSVVKLSRKSIKAHDHLENECQLLNLIHSNGLIKGIQWAPAIVFEGGYITLKYEMSGSLLMHNLNDRTLSLSVSDKETIATDLIKSLNTLHQDLGIYHGDIKPANLLYFNCELFISDFGGARKFSQLVPLSSYPKLKNIYCVWTPQFVSNNIAMKVREILKSQKAAYKRSSEKEMFLSRLIQEEIVPLLVSNDKFALGLTLYRIFVDNALLFSVEPNTGKSVVSSFSLNKINRKLMQSDFSPTMQEEIYSLLQVGIVESER
jgi:serine/threonine protein kinase